MKMTDNEIKEITTMFRILAQKFEVYAAASDGEGPSTEGATLSIDIGITYPGCAPKKLFSSKITRTIHR